MGATGSIPTLKEEGNAKFKRGLFSEAEKFYTLALCEDSENSKLLTNRSAAYFEQQEFGKALVDAENAIVVDPSWEKPWFRAGKALEAMGREIEALDHFEKALALSSARNSGNDKLLQGKVDNLRSAIRPHNRGSAPLWTWEQGEPIKPIEALRGRDISDVSCGAGFTVACCSTGECFGWGLNSVSQLGLGHCSPVLSPHPLLVAQKVLSVACGAGHALAHCSSGIVAWGLNKQGQCGVGHTLPVTTPCAVEIEETELIVGLACGIAHSVVVVQDRYAPEETQTFVFGWNSAGQLGIGNCTDVSGPVCLETAVSDEKMKIELRKIRHVSCGGAHTLLSAASRVFAAGSNTTGQLGLGDRVDRCRVSRVRGGWSRDSPVVFAAAGEEYSFFITASRRVYSCGLNNVGQCCLPVAAETVHPTEVSALCDRDLEEVICAQREAYGLSKDGKLFHWGGEASRAGEVEESALLRRKTVLRLQRGRRHFAAVTDGISSANTAAIGAVPDRCCAADRVKFLIQGRTRLNKEETGGGCRLVANVFDVKEQEWLVPGSIALTEAGVEDNFDGTFEAYVRINRAGIMRIHVVLNGQDICGSPYPMTVAPSIPVAGCCCVLDSSLEISSQFACVAGIPVVMKLLLRDKFFNRIPPDEDCFPVTVEIDGVAPGEDARSTVITTVNSADGILATCLFCRSGEHSVVWFVNSVPFGGSPLVVTVSPCELDAAMCYCDAVDDASRTAVAGQKSALTLVFRDAFGNAVEGEQTVDILCSLEKSDPELLVSGATLRSGETVLFSAPPLAGVYGIFARFAASKVRLQGCSVLVLPGVPCSTASSLTGTSLVLRDQFKNLCCAEGVTAHYETAKGQRVAAEVQRSSEECFAVVRPALTAPGLYVLRIRLGSALLLEGSPMQVDAAHECLPMPLPEPTAVTDAPVAPAFRPPPPPTAPPPAVLADRCSAALDTAVKAETGLREKVLRSRLSMDKKRKRPAAPAGGRCRARRTGGGFLLSFDPT